MLSLIYPNHQKNQNKAMNIIEKGQNLEPYQLNIHGQEADPAKENRSNSTKNQEK